MPFFAVRRMFSVLQAIESNQTFFSVKKQVTANFEYNSKSLIAHTSSTRLHKGNQRNLVAFLRPGKPLAQTGVEIGEAKVKPATAACHGVVTRSRKRCEAPRSRAERQVELMENIRMTKVYYVYLLV